MEDSHDRADQLYLLRGAGRDGALQAQGGVETDIKGATRINGIWAAGEVACVSLHGANRLGSNSTAECLVWGKVCGAETATYCNEMKDFPDVPEAEVEAEKAKA